MEITIYSKTICPHCTQAKNYLKQNNVTYTEVNLDNDAERQEFYAKCGPSVRTVPQIFVDGERIGGFQDLLRSDVVARYRASGSSLTWD